MLAGPNVMAKAGELVSIELIAERFSSPVFAGNKIMTVCLRPSVILTPCSDGDGEMGPIIYQIPHTPYWLIIGCL